MSEQIEELVKAAVQKELKKIQAVDTSTGKTKKKTSPELDTTRTMGEHVQDPRSSTDCWPCMGKHIPKAGGNKWGQWLECDRCALRLKYTPTKGSPAEFTHIALPANVTRALNHLRSEGFTKEDCNNRLVKQTIKFITSQEAINSAKSSVNKAKALAKSKGYPKNAVEVSEIPIHSDEEDPMFEVISSEKKKSKAQESTSSET